MFKKITSILLALVMVLSLMTVGVVNVSAEIVDSGECGEDVTYTLDDNGTLTITGTGDIWNYCFNSNTEIREVIIEDGITSIDAVAFGNCSSLTSVTIGNSVTSIGEFAFNNCESLTSVTIPDSVTSISEGAFRKCSSLTSVTIPDSVTSIGHHAFYDCSNLSSVTIGNSVTSIGEYAFYNCSLTSVTIPDSVTSISEGAFWQCSSITKVTIPDSVTTIGPTAFLFCSSHTDAYTSNQLAIDALLGFHHSDLGEYYVNYDEPNMIMQSGGSRSAIVTLDYETANLRVTVPTVLPVSVDSDNNVTVATDAQISNLSNGSVDVTNAEIQTDEWSVVGFNTDFTKVPVDTKQYSFELNGDDVSDGVNTSVFNTINGNDHIGLSYDANVAIQSNATSDEEIGRIVFTVAWHK